MLGPPGLRQLAGRRALAALAAAATLAGCGDDLAGGGGEPSRDEEPARGDVPAGAHGFPGPSGTQGARVESVTDGDTLRIAGIGRVRLIGIDTPEVRGGAECGGAEASAFAERVAGPGTPVRYRLGREPRDRFGRALAYVWLPDGRMLNGLIVERGHARPLRIAPNTEFAARFERAAGRARRRGIGLWNCPETTSGVRRCSDFSSREEAQRHLDRNPGAPLDGDGDGRACETLP